MAKTDTVRLATGEYLVKGTGHKIVCVNSDPGLWELRDGDRILGEHASKRQALLASWRIHEGKQVTPPPAQGSGKQTVVIAADLASFLETVKPSRPGYHYVVLEVANA